MKEVYWVVGESAAGKETFIKNMISGNLTELEEKLNIKNKKIIASKESLRLIGVKLSNKRELILVEIPKLLKDADVVFIKWQSVDSKTDLMNRLKVILPSAKHIIIKLDASKEELIKRLPLKPLWRKYGKAGDEEKLVDHDKFKVKQIITSMKNYKIIIIDANNKNYKIFKKN